MTVSRFIITIWFLRQHVRVNNNYQCVHNFTSGRVDSVNVVVSSVVIVSLLHVKTYSVSQKSSSPKTFCGIFSPSEPV